LLLFGRLETVAFAQKPDRSKTLTLAGRLPGNFSRSSPPVSSVFLSYSYSLSTHKEAYLTLNRGGDLTGEEVCERLKLSARTLQEYRSRGLLAFYKIGGKMLL